VTTTTSGSNNSNDDDDAAAVTILHQHPLHLALKDKPPIRHNSHSRNNMLALSLPSLPMFELDPRNVLSRISPAQFQQQLAYWP
jgi:hypothetical protein